MDPGSFHVQDPAAAGPAAPEPTAPEAAAPASATPVGTEPADAAPAAPAAAAARARGPRRPLRWGDLIASIVLLVLLGAAATGASVFAALLSFASDSCSAAGCNFTLMSTGIWFALISPWIVFAVAVVGVILLVIFRKLSFWVPLTAFLLIVALWLVGAVLVWAAT
jgi:hypothetical protein